MKLHDQNRPKINHKLAFDGGHSHIPPLQLWPLSNGLIELAMMLPLQDNRFSGRYFSCQVELSDLSDTISDFIHSPEQFVQEYLVHEGQTPPAIYGQKAPEPITRPTTQAVLDGLSILEEE